MSDEWSLKKVETIFNYRFRSRDRLSEAITAAGAEDENHDGNRRLSGIGLDVLSLFLNIDGVMDNAERREISVRKQQLCCVHHRAFVAKRIAIDQCIKYCPRSGAGGAKVLGECLSAVIGAIYMDSGSHTRTWETLQHIGFFIQKDSGVNPELLSADSLYDLNYPIIDSFTHSREILGQAESTASAITAQPQALRMDIGPNQESESLSVRENNENPAQDVMNQARKRTIGACNPEGETKKLRKCIAGENGDIMIFLSQESLKCTAYSLPAPDESYWNVAVRGWMSTATNDRSFEVAKGLLLGVASPQAVANLQATIQSWRVRPVSYSLQVSHLPSKPEIFHLIEKIDQEIGTLRLFRRYYVLDLFEMCGGCETPSCSGFVQQCPERLNAAGKQSGNLRYRAEHEVTESMMREIFPHLRPGMREYQGKLNEVKSLRRVGRKLYILAQRFGKGILAMIPYQESSDQPDMVVTDKMLSRCPEKVFSEIVAILDTYQGDILRQFSAATLKIVEKLLHARLGDCDPFVLESTSTVYIMELPKNSPSLLKLLL